MKRKKNSNIILYLVIFGIGCCLGKLCNWGYFILKKDISLIEALSLFVTVGCAIYIAKILEKEVQDNRVEKNLFLEQLTLIEKPLQIIDDILDSKNSSYTDIISNYSKSNRIKCKLFQRIDLYNQTLTKDSKTIKCREDISSNLKFLKKLLTDTPVVKQTKPDIEIRKGKISYSESRVIEIREVIQLINDDLFALKIIINSM